MHRSSCHAAFEQLEIRRLLASEFRSIDGTGNNLGHDEWGSAGAQLVRKASAEYGDGISTPAGADRPSARRISNTVSAAPEEGTRNSRDLSALVYAFGQFIDHDLDLTPNASPAQAFNVRVPTGDPEFDPASRGGAVINLNRSVFDSGTGTSRSNPRQQTNVITAWLDGSVIYGSDDVRARALRTLSGGRLKTSAGNLPPYNSFGLTTANDAHIRDDTRLFVAGDVRANENIDLTAIHTLFLREHNRLASQIASANPGLSDEQIYQRARQIVVAEFQAITYNAFLPALLGNGAMPAYHGYNANVNPGVANEFSTAGFRLGHSLLGPDVEFLDNDGEDVREEVALREAFFDPTTIEEVGVDPILKYLSSDPAQELDTQVVEDVRSFLFGPPGSGGFDLASLNIQRGRDHGLADYNSVRAAYGLRRVDSFDDITSNRTLQQQLRSLYGSVENIDLWVGGLAEDHVSGGSLGPLLRRVVVDQFTRVRDGDRYWYERVFSGDQLREIRQTTLTDLIRRNTSIDNLQDNVFIFDVTIAGTVFSDRNRNGRQDRGEDGIRGVKVQLTDEAGETITVETSSSGRYSFGDLELGEFSVTAITPRNTNRIGEAEKEVTATRGQTLGGVDFAFAPSQNEQRRRDRQDGRDRRDGRRTRSLSSISPTKISEQRSLNADRPKNFAWSDLNL